MFGGASPFLIRRARTAALLLGALALSVGGATAAETRGATKLVPEDTLLLISIDDFAGYQKSLQDMPLYKIIHEDEVQKFLEKPKAALDELVKTMQTEVRKQEGFENFELSLEKLSAGEYGRVFLALTHISMPDEQAGKVMPDIGLVLAVEGRQGAPNWIELIKDLAMRGAKNAGKDYKFETVTADGFTYEELKGGTGKRPPVLMASVGDLQLFSISHEALRAVMSRANGSKDGSLADSAVYMTAEGVIGSGTPQSMRLFLNVDTTLKTIVESVKIAMEMDEQAKAYIPMVDKLVAMSGLSALKSVYSISESEKGVAHSKTFFGVQGPRVGLLACSPETPIALDHLKVVPNNATSASLFQFDIASIYDLGMKMLKEIDPDIHAQAQASLQGIGAMIGGQEHPLDLREDILGNLGPEYLMFQPQSSNPTLPSYILMAQVRNGDRVTQALKAIAEYGAQFAGGQVAIKESEYKGSKFYELSFQETPIPVSPCFSVQGDYLMFALSVGDLKRQIRRAEKAGGGDITENADFQRFFGSVPKDDSLRSISYTDVKYAVESTYGTVMTFLPMIVAGADQELPLDMALLPTQETISQHLFGAMSYSASIKEGAIIEGFSPVGGEALGVVGAAAGGAALFFLGARASHEVLPPDAIATSPSRASDPADQARHDLSTIQSGIVIYKLEYHSLPKSLDDLLIKNANYPDGCLGMPELPMDPWGHGYRYKVQDDGYMVWSFGPNGADDQGEGDDIVKRK